MWAYLAVTLGISLAINIVMFLVAFRRKTDKLTDISYALSFIALVGFAFLQGASTPFRIVLATAITIWALRLGGFLLYRIWRTGKDSRFDDIRDNFWKFGKFWMSQGLAVWIILVPALLALRYESASFGLLAELGLIIWAAGFCIETVADLQKYHFSQRQANKNKWIESGLWHYSRHPNYFGEILVWVGIYVYCLAVLTPLEAIIGLVSPIFIKILLLFVSGIPILEKSADTRWGRLSTYQTYKRETSVLVPLPRKK